MKSNSPSAAKGPHRDPARERSWRQLLKQFAAGGQSVREFCAVNRLKETTFYFWRAEIQRREGQAPARRQRPTPRRPAFAKVLVQPPVFPAAEAALRLRLGSGRELLLPASWSVQRVAELLRALEGQPATEDAA